METLRTGIVTNRYPRDATVRVRLVGYSDSYVSHPLPVVHRKTRRDKDYWLPDVGEHVLCVFERGGLEQGYVLGALYSKEDRPSAGLTEDEGEVHGFEDESGLSVRVNRARRTAEVEHSSGSRVSMNRDGEVEVRAAGVLNLVSSDGKSRVSIDTESGIVRVGGRDKTEESAPVRESDHSEDRRQAGRSIDELDSRDVTVTGGSKENVAGSRSVTVGSGESKAVAGDRSELVAGKSEHTSGEGEKTTVVTGDFEIDVVTGQIRLKALAGIKLEAATTSIELSTLLAKITGGQFQVNGQAVPTGSGPFCALPACMFTGAPHTGNLVAGT